MNTSIAVYGASGHTGGFVVAELRSRGYTPIPLGRADATPDDPAALDRALRGAAAVINCAGPFATTAAPLIDAAIRAGVPYVDVCAEIEATADTLARYADAPVPVLPATAFFGGLADLLATAALAGRSADEIQVAYALSSWHPTPGTRASGAVSRGRRDGRRVRFTGGRLDYHDAPPTTGDWPFPDAPRPVATDFTMTDVVTIPHHIAVPEVRTHMSANAAHDVATSTAPPAAQTFLVDVHIRAGDDTLRATATGTDIYAVTAPMAVEAAHRLLADRHPGGATTAGALFDARGFLAALAPRITVLR